MLVLKAKAGNHQDSHPNCLIDLKINMFVLFFLGTLDPSLLFSSLLHTILRDVLPIVQAALQPHSRILKIPCQALAIRTLNIPGLTRAVTGTPGRPSGREDPNSKFMPKRNCKEGK